MVDPNYLSKSFGEGGDVLFVCSPGRGGRVSGFFAVKMTNRVDLGQLQHIRSFGPCGLMDKAPVSDAGD